MLCPNCRQIMAPLARECKNCGQPGLGSLIGQSIFTPEEEQKQWEAMGQFFAFVFKIAFVGIVVWGLALCVMWIGSGVAQIPFGAIFSPIGHALTLLFKVSAIAALIFLPFALFGGYLAKSNGRSYAEGYWWGQLAGPVGFLVVVFMESKVDESAKWAAWKSKPPVAATPVPLATFPFLCPLCGRKYKVTEQAVGKPFRCVGCGCETVVSATTVPSDGEEEIEGRSDYH